MPKILHIANDEKFTEAANFIYEKAFPNSNTFFIITPNTLNYRLKHISKRKNYIFYTNNRKSIKEISKQINNYDLIILHNFIFFHAQIVKRKPYAIYNWVFWGAEIYNRHKSFKNLILGNKTKKLIKKQSIYKKTRKYFGNILKRKVINPNVFPFKYIKYISYFSILHKEDYELFLNKGILNNSIKYLKFTYYPIEFIFGDNKKMRINGNNILLGNSAALTNNHTEAVDILKTLKLSNRKVITPLSYGDVEYVNDIITYGKKALSENFSPLTEFLPLQEFNKLLQTCSIIIINSYRQQAVGNILASMWMGAKVFLDKRNTFYHYLKRIGCFVYSVEELNNDNLNNLTLEQIEHNRKILFKEINTKTIVATLRNDINNIVKQ